MGLCLYVCVVGYLSLVLSAAQVADECPSVKQDCTCDFSGDAADGGANMASDAASKSELLAAAAGAMSPLLLFGAALGIYKMVKSKGDGEFKGMHRSMSTLSDTSSPRSLPPGYSSRRGSLQKRTPPSSKPPASDNMWAIGGDF